MAVSVSLQRPPPPLSHVYCKINGCMLVFDRDLQARKEVREQAWKVEGWSETVSKVHVTLSVMFAEGPQLTFNLLQSSEYSQLMNSFILEPLSYSPLK